MLNEIKSWAKAYNSLEADKRGFSGASIKSWIIGFVFFIALLKVVAELLPEGQSAGDALNATGAPLGTFFQSDGLIWLLVMIGILIGSIALFIKSKSK